jgi:hypothetical protein
VSYPPGKTPERGGALGRRVDERRRDLPAVAAFVEESIEEVDGVQVLVRHDLHRTSPRLGVEGEGA